MIVFFGNFKAQVGINTTTPTHTLDVNGSIRVRNLANAEKKIVATDQQGGLILIAPEEVVSPKALLNTSTSSAEQRLTLYEGKCFQPSDNASSCTVSFNHYSSCLGFVRAVDTKVIVGQTIDTGNGQFAGVWTARYIDHKGYIGVVMLPARRLLIIREYPIIRQPIHEQDARASEGFCFYLSLSVTLELAEY